METQISTTSMQEIAFPPFELKDNIGEVSPQQLSLKVFGKRDSVLIKCPYWKDQGETLTKKEISSAQWMIWLTLTIVWFPFPCVPCLIPACYNVKHVWSKCNKYIGDAL